MKKSLLLMAMACLVACGEKVTKTENATSDFVLDTIMTPDQIAARRFTPEVMWKMGRMGSAILSPDGSKVLYQLTRYNVEQNKSSTALFVQPFGGGAAEMVTGWGWSDNSPEWSADGQKIYFLSNRDGDQQLYEVTMTNAGQRHINKLSDVKGGVGGFGVSKNGKRVWFVAEVAVEKINSSDVFADMPKSKARIYNDLMVRHWDHWENGVFSHLFVADFSAAGVVNPVDITAGEPWDVPTAPYFDATEIAWNNAGTAVAYTARKLTGYEYSISTNTDIFLYNMATSKTSNLTEGMPGYDKYPRFSPDDRQIAWQSMERAGNESDKDRLMVMNVDGSNKRDLTAKFDYNAGNVIWGENGATLYFIAPIQATCQICSVDLSTDSVQVLTSGSHDYTDFTKVGTNIAAGKTTLSMANEWFAVNLIDGTDAQRSFVNKNIYDNVDMGRVEKRWVTTTDNKQMLTWVILPPNFDSTKKYPTLLYCQGGPQSVVSQRWSFRWNFQLMAAQDYITVAPNRRGLPSFGQEWLDQISGDYSGQNIKDYLSAIDDVSKESWADETRMGCVGASYGGYSVFYLAGHHENRFKALISHCGIFDFTSMYGETEELWFVNNDYGGPYWDMQNPVAQRSYANSPHHFVNNWTAPILIFTGEKDYRIPYAQSLEAFTAARAHGIDARLVVFEDEAHQVFKPQNSIVWNREFFGWLDKYLKK